MASIEQFSRGFPYRVVTANGLRMAVREGGRPDAERTVVLLHGWPQHSLMWHEVAPRLGERFRVVVPDLRGAGGTTIARGGYDKATMADDVAALLDALGVGTASVVGYDLGSGVAYALAAGHPGRVDRLVLSEFALPGFGYEEYMQPREEWDPGANWHLSFFTVPDVAEMAFRGRERALLAWFFNHIANDPSAVSGEHFEEYVRQVSRPGALRAGIEYYAAVWADGRANRALAARVGPLAIPAMGVGGEASAGAYVGMALQPLAASVRTEVVPRAGHWLGDENPAAYAAILLDFLTSAG